MLFKSNNKTGLKVFLMVFYFFSFIKPAWNGSVREYIKLTQSDEMLLLDEHNKYRRMVQPTATNMLEMIWDPELAQFAEEYSRNCDFLHSSGGSTSKFSSLGENIYLTSQVGISNENVIVSGVKGWYDEYVDYDYNLNSCNQGKVCGHYTQVVWANSYAVGCGITSCNNIYTYPQGSLLICNYGPPGNYIGQKPYKAGATCFECKEGTTCVNKLCQNGTRESDLSATSTANTLFVHSSKNSTASTSSGNFSSLTKPSPKFPCPSRNFRKYVLHRILKLISTFSNLLNFLHKSFV